MKFKTIAFTAALALALGLTQGIAQNAAPAPTPAPVATAEITQVRRPAVEFLEFGDVVGVASSLLERLDMKEGDALLIRTPNGVEFAAETKVWGNAANTLFAKETIRKVLGIEDGAVRLQVAKVVWPTGAPADREVELNNVVRPPQAFLDYGDAVGVSYPLFKALNAAPGAKARIAGPGGSRIVTLQLLDRGAQTISMKQTLRNAIGVGEGEGNPVKIRVMMAAPASVEGNATQQ